MVRALASPALAVRRKVGCSLNNYWTSHLGGAAEPSGATRRPRGRPGGRLSAPTAMDGSDDVSGVGRGLKFIGRADARPDDSRITNHETLSTERYTVYSYIAIDEFRGYCVPVETQVYMYVYGALHHE